MPNFLRGQKRPVAFYRCSKYALAHVALVSKYDTRSHILNREKRQNSHYEQGADEKEEVSERVGQSSERKNRRKHARYSIGSKSASAGNKREERNYCANSKTLKHTREKTKNNYENKAPIIGTERRYEKMQNVGIFIRMRRHGRVISCTDRLTELCSDSTVLS